MSVLWRHERRILRRVATRLQRWCLSVDTEPPANTVSANRIVGAPVHNRIVGVCVRVCARVCVCACVRVCACARMCALRVIAG